MNDNHHREKRRYRRVSVSLPARLSIWRNGRLVSEITRLIDVSARGAYLGCNKDIRPGEELEISIVVPQSVYMASPPATFTGSATAVRVNRESPPRAKRLGVGLKFKGNLAFHLTSMWTIFIRDPYE